MKTLILSPLFPPDVGDPALYVKELASILPSADTVLLVYGHLPESVTGVSTKTIDKRNVLPLRLFRFTVALFKTSKDADLIIINNAPSTELPALILSFFRSPKMLLCVSDPIANTVSGRGFYGLIHLLLRRNCQKVIILPKDQLYKKAEVLPFITFDTSAEAMRQTWWQKHIADIQSL